MKPGRALSATGVAGAALRPSRVIPEKKQFEPPPPEQLLHSSRHAPDSGLTDAKGKAIPVVEALDPHEFVPDARAGYGRPYRTVDTLAAMEWRKAIEPHDAAAGRRFQEDFEWAALNQLRAGNLSLGSLRRGAYVGLELLTEAMAQALQDVDAIMRASGSRESPAGSVVWGRARRAEEHERVL